MIDTLRKTANLLEFHRINNTQVNMYNSLQILLIARTYCDLLMRIKSKPNLSIAYVGYDPRLLTLSEGISDCGGMGPTEMFFEGREDDYGHSSKPLEFLEINKFDALFIADIDKQKEDNLVVRLQELFENNNTQTIDHSIRIMRLVDAHIATSKKCIAKYYHSCLNIHKLAVISLATYLAPKQGAVVECGSYRGGTTVWISLMQRLLHIDRPIFALDTYEGLPAPVEKDGNTIWQEGIFNETSLRIVEKFYKKHGVSSNIHMIKGLIQQTFPEVWKRTEKIALAFLDTDQYAGTSSGLNEIVPRLSKYGLIIIDDTTCQGVDFAIKEAMTKFPRLRRISLRRNFDLLYVDNGNRIFSNFID